MEVPGRTFLVTGGASGLGAASVCRLAQGGANVLIVDLDEDTGEELAADIGEQARFARADVTDEESTQKALDAARDAFGGLHGLVNCAGIGPAEKVVGKRGPHSLDSFIKTVQINLIGTFNPIRLAAPVMMENKPDEGGERGVIINTASVVAYDGQIGQVAYAASKGGVVSMTLPAAREMAEHGIRVMAIAPGIFETPMFAGLPEKARASLGKQVPFPSRLGRPEEYAALVQHIIENSMLNGEVIRLDGAIRMAPS